MNENALSTAPESREAAGQLDHDVRQLARITEQMTKLYLAMDARMRAMESILSQRVTVTSAQAKVIRMAVQERARVLCDKHSLPYSKAGQAVRRTIWRDIKAQYGIGSIYDLPATYYDLVLDYSREWSSFALMRKLAEKHRT